MANQVQRPQRGLVIQQLPGGPSSLHCKRLGIKIMNDRVKSKAKQSVEYKRKRKSKKATSVLGIFLETYTYMNFKWTHTFRLLYLNHDRNIQCSCSACCF